jgi:hypothetical protein
MTTETLFDVDSIADIGSAEVNLKVNGQPVPGVFVTLAGPEHAVRKSYALDKARRMRKQLARTGKLELDDPVDEQEDETVHMASCVLAWRGIGKGGQALPCTKENVLALLADPAKGWFRRAVKEALDDVENFIKRSAAP